MRLWGTILLVSTTLFGFEYGLKPVEIREGIYCFFGVPEAMNTINNGNMVNSCFADMGSGWLVIDSGPTYRYAREATAVMQSVRKMPVTYVVNTHIHDDHWLGNNYYIEIGATVLGSEAFKDEVVATPTRMQSRISAAAYDKTVPAFPKDHIREQHTIATPHGDIVIEAVGHQAHTRSDLYVYLPYYRALFAGDLVFNDRLPSLRSGDINGWIETLERIDAMDLDIIVGGHGFRYDKASTAFTLEYLRALRSGIEKVLDDGGDIDDAVASLTLETYRDAGMYDTMHHVNINAAFRTLEWSDD